MTRHEYPRILYHADGTTCLVGAHAERDAMLARGYHLSEAEAHGEPAPERPPLTDAVDEPLSVPAPDHLEYPRILYRTGGETRVVATEEDRVSALAEGYVLTEAEAEGHAAVAAVSEAPPVGADPEAPPKAPKASKARKATSADPALSALSTE